MKKLKIPFLSLFLVLLMLAGCTKTGEDPLANKLPDTSILSYVISSVAEADSAGRWHEVTVYWAGSDVGGGVTQFNYSTDQGATWILTGQTQNIFVFDFTASGASHDVWVASVDDDGDRDSSPAKVTIMQDLTGIETRMMDGPTNGSRTSSAVQYRIEATAQTGSITHIAWSVDNNSLTNEEATDEYGQATFDITDLTTGAHLIYFAGKRDDGVLDSSPLTLNVDVRPGYVPEIGFSFPDNEATFFVPAGTSQDTVVVTWESDFQPYQGTLDHYEYKMSTDTGWTNTGELAEATLTNMPGGTYQIFMRTYDIAGGVSEDSLLFYVADLYDDNGVLFVNGIDWATYMADNTGMWGDRMLMGNVTEYKYWDVFTDNSTYPASIADVMGKGSIPPFIISTQYFSTIVWAGNSYNGDLPFWDEQYDNLVAFLNDGGNLILCGRQGQDFFDSDDHGDTLSLYAGISEWSGLVTINDDHQLIAQDPNLVDMTAGNGNTSASRAQVCKLDGSVAEASAIFSFDTEWVGGFRVAPTDGKGEFIFIAGREYRLDTQASFDNYDYILRTWFGEQ